jgi:putative FmdB family regulatory protein
MPIYRYECQACGEFEIEQKITDEPLKKCDCGKKLTKLVPLSVGFHVPAWMSAQGSHASEKQDAYLRSDKHRQNRAKQEREREAEIQREARLESGRKKLSETIVARCQDNAKYSDQTPQAVAQRAKRYSETKFAS